MRVFFSHRLIRRIGPFGEGFVLKSDVYEWLIQNVGWGSSESVKRPAAQWYWYMGSTVR